MTARARLKIGDVAHVAAAGSTQLTRPCRVCDGRKWVTLVTGRGEHVRLDCQFCARGLQDPTGIEEYYDFVAAPRAFVVRGVQVEETAAGEVVTYRDADGGCWHNYKAEDCWSTAEGAMDRSLALVREHEIEQAAAMTRKKDDNKSYAWHAGYHLRQAKDHRRQAEYHERKAVIMKGKDRTAPTTEAP